MRLRVSIVASIFALLLGAFSIGGATMAWFTAGSDTMENTFTAGTVSFSLGDPIPGTKEEGCLPVNWQIDYTGSKQAYLRVKPVVEVAEIETIYIAIRAVLGNGNSYWAVGVGEYFTYKLNTYTETNKFFINLERGANKFVDTYIWDDGNELNFEFKANQNNDNHRIRSINIYVGTMPPPSTDPNTFPYRLPDTGNFDPVRSEVDYSIPFDDFIGMPGGSVEIQLCDPDDPWVEGNNGWWYYDEVVDSGDQIEVCFKFCVGSGYTADISYYLEAEAVQASHGAIDYLWPNRGWDPP